MFRGEYSPTARYYGTPDRRDVVKLGDTYYIALTTAGELQGSAPPNKEHWAAFGGSFSSVATELLLAQETYLENAVVKKLKTDVAPHRRIETVGSEMRVYGEGAKHAGIVLGYQKDEHTGRDMPVLRFFSSDGLVIYELGANGFKVPKEQRPNHYEPILLRKLDYAEIWDGRGVLKTSVNEIIRPLHTAYQFFEGYIVPQDGMGKRIYSSTGTEQPGIYNERIYESKNLTYDGTPTEKTQHIEDGWYLVEVSSGDQYFKLKLRGGKHDSTAVYRYYAEAAKVEDGRIVYYINVETEEEEEPNDHYVPDPREYEPNM